MIFKYLFLATVILLKTAQTTETEKSLPEAEDAIYPQPDEIHRATSDLVFFIFPKDCVDQMLKFDLRTDCIMRILSNGMSLGLVLFSLYYKVPQIMKILTEKSAKSISPASVLMEIMAALCGIAYYFYLDYDFMAYGEMISGMFQSMIILSLCYVYMEMGSSTATIYFGLIVGSLGGIYYKMLPKAMVSSLLLLSSVVFCLSRIMLIISVFKTKSSGSLSFITLFLSMVGILVRLFTTFINISDDKFLLLIIAINAIFSSLLFFIALAFKQPKKLKAN